MLPMTVIDPNGAVFEMETANAYDLVTHAGWSFQSDVAKVSGRLPIPRGLHPAVVVVVSPDGKFEEQKYENAADLVNVGWRLATPEETAAFRGEPAPAPSAPAQNAPAADGTYDPHKDLPVSHPDLVVFASANNLELKDGLTGEELRADLLKQWDALKSATTTEDLPAEGSDRNALKAFAEKHDLKLTVVGKSNDWIRNDLIEQFKAKQKA